MRTVVSVWIRALFVPAMILGFVHPERSWAAETRIAVAANFAAPAREIAHRFEDATGHRAILSFGSTGRIYAQIVHGAPFDVFLSADVERPRLAEARGWAVSGSRFTYAIGRLVLWSRDPDRIDATPVVLRQGDFARIAIANPKTAPYGSAAVEALRALGVWRAVRPKLAQAESIAQAHSFVATGNADLGLVALAQVVLDETGSRWLVPAELHSPIRQQAVLLRRGADEPAARAFIEFLQGAEARAIVQRYGYDTP